MARKSTKLSDKTADTSTVQRAEAESAGRQVREHRRRRVRGARESSTSVRASTARASAKQAIAIGLSKARRAGVPLAA